MFKFVFDINNFNLYGVFGVSYFFFTDIFFILVLIFVNIVCNIFIGFRIIFIEFKDVFLFY